MTRAEILAMVRGLSDDALEAVISGRVRPGPDRGADLFIWDAAIDEETRRADDRG